MLLSIAQLEAQHQLIERAKHDPEAFGELFDAHYSMILNYVARRTGDMAAAQDITSAVFMKALQGIASFKWRGVPVSAWLYRIAGNEIRMYYRGHKQTVSLDELLEDNGFEVPDETDLLAELQSAQAALDSELEYRLAQTAMRRLPAKYQEVLALRFGEDKRLAEIATILGKKEGTVKSLLSRALTRLRGVIQDSETQPSADNGIMGSEGRNNTNKSQETT